jgi:tRNA G10  N-methylase Trm11
MTEPSPSDIVLDPFCGCGGIAAARAQNFPFRAAYASDTDLRRVKKVPQVVYREADISKLHEWLPADSVDKIVTDPPWGLYDTGLDIAELYAVMFEQFERVLTSDGVIVLLTAQKELTRRLLQEPRFKLSITQAYDILVSGKKAGVFVIKRTTPADKPAHRNAHL